MQFLFGKHFIIFIITKTGKENIFIYCSLLNKPKELTYSFELNCHNCQESKTLCHESLLYNLP